MPAVLLELGFISNDNDLAALRQKSSRDKLAERIFQAFKEYKEIYDGSVDAPAPEGERPPAVSAPPADSQPKADAQPASDGKTVYAVQVFAVKKKMDPKAKEFMGYTPRIIRSGDLYKYYIGVSDSAAGARKNLPAIRKKYPDAFVVKISGETVTRVQ